MFQLLGAFAEFERNLIKERVVAGLNHAKAKGVKLGRPAPDFDKDELIRLVDMGLSTRAIAARMDLKKTFVHKTVQSLMFARKTIENVAPPAP